MKKLIIPLIVILGVFASLVIAFFWWVNVIAAPSSDKTDTNFLITKGMSASQIGIKLQDSGIIKNATAFKIYTQATGKSKNIQAGEYLLPKNTTLYHLVDELLKGPTQIWVTIPEGLRREQVAIKFADSLGKEGIDWESFFSEFLDLTSQKEGFLFPDTYLIPKDITPVKIVGAMDATYAKMTKELNLDARSGYSEKQIITIASMIERETRNETERPGVAGVLYNRLNAGWPLQVDATIQYVVASLAIHKISGKQAFDNFIFWGDISKDNLELSSPYNTYKYPGLPPGPIANPGVSSISAAANPAQNDYFFYLHDSEGKIHFSKTLEEHNANVRKYLGK